MFRRTHRVFVGLLVILLVGSCKTIEDKTQLTIDTTMLQNTVAKSFHFALTDTIDFFLLNVDSTRPTRRLVRHTQVAQKDTTQTHTEQSRIQMHAHRVVHEREAPSPITPNFDFLWSIIKLCILIIVLCFLLKKARF